MLPFLLFPMVQWRVYSWGIGSPQNENSVIIYAPSGWWKCWCIFFLKLCSLQNISLTSQQKKSASAFNNNWSRWEIGLEFGCATGKKQVLVLLIQSIASVLNVTIFTPSMHGQAYASTEFLLTHITKWVNTEMILTFKKAQTISFQTSFVSQGFRDLNFAGQAVCIFFCVCFKTRPHLLKLFRRWCSQSESR